MPRVNHRCTTPPRRVLSPQHPLRRLLDVWGFCPPFAVPAEDTTLVTRDGVRLAASYLPGPALPRAGVPAVVLLHGFGGHRRKPAYRALAERLSARAAVLVPDLRGHGGSAGRCTFGDREIHDVRAATAWLRRHGHSWVALVGASMGAAAVLRAAGTGPPGFADAICTVSAPGAWLRGGEASSALRGVARLATNGWCRVAVGPALRVRMAAWHPHEDPDPPVAVVGRVAPTPLLLVHSADDHYFSLVQADALAAAAPEAVRWVVGTGHAEDLFTPAFSDRLVAAVLHVHATGAWPRC